MRIFHIATASDWEQSQTAGSYSTSTRDRTLAEEGFLHACRGDQWQGVRERYYGDIDEPLVLLAIDPELLTSPLVEETPAGASETYPHIYGPLNLDAVVSTIPLGATRVDPVVRGAGTARPSFSQLFLAELFHNVRLGAIVMFFVAGGSLAGGAIQSEAGVFVGLLLGSLVGISVAVRVNRRRSRAG